MNNENQKDILINDADSNFDNVIFITEDDTFTIDLKWYIDNKKIKVEGLDDYDLVYAESNNININSFSVTLKFPSYGDYDLINKDFVFSGVDQITIQDVKKLELSRLSVLIRSWSLKKELSWLYNMDPLIVNGILLKVREVIDMKGVF